MDCTRGYTTFCLFFEKQKILLFVWNLFTEAILLIDYNSYANTNIYINQNRFKFIRNTLLFPVFSRTTW